MPMPVAKEAKAKDAAAPMAAKDPRGGASTPAKDMKDVSKDAKTVSKDAKSASKDAKGVAKAPEKEREDPAGTSGSSAASSPPASPSEQRAEGAEGELVRGKSLSVDRSSRPHFKEGIRLAEMGRWSTLVERLAQGETQLARHKDHHGMVPLHWACTEDDVPTAAVSALLAAFPEAVLTKNNAQYLPLHLAIRARVGADTLRVLAAARPSSLLVETPAGKTAVGLARDVGLPKEAMSVLEHFEKEYLDLNADSDDDDNAQIENAKREYALQSQRLRDSMLHPPPLNVTDLRSNNAPDHAIVSGSNHPNSAGNMSFDASFGPLEMINGSFGPMDAIAGDLARSSNQSFSSQTGTSAPMVTSLSFVGGTLVQQHQHSEMTIEEEVATPGGTLTLPHSQSSRGASTTVNGAVPLPSRAATTRGFADHNPFASHYFDNDGHDSGVCGVCYKKFNVFRKKYQCKSCFAYLCKKHVAGKVALPNFTKKRSVCGDCYRMHRNGPVPVTMPGATNNNAGNNINGAATTASSNSNSTMTGQSSTAHGNAISGPLRPHTGTNLSTRSVSVASSTGTNGNQGNGNNGNRNNDKRKSSSSSNHTAGNNGPHHDQHREVENQFESSQVYHNSRNNLGNSMVMTRTARAESTHSIVGRPSTVVGPQTSMRYSTTNVRNRGQSGAVAGQRRNSSLLLPDRPHSDTTASVSFSDTDPASSASMLLRASAASMQEVTALNLRISTLEECNKLLLNRVAEQEKQYDEAMLLLTQTMTRVAEMEMRVPNDRKSYRGTGGSTTASERASEIFESDIKFSFPTPFTEKFD